MQQGFTTVMDEAYGSLTIEDSGLFTFQTRRTAHPYFPWPTCVVDGNLCVCFSGALHRVDQLVADNFGLGGEGEIEHIDGNPLNCNIANLRRVQPDDTPRPLPQAFAYAQEHGIDLRKVTGSGKGGRILISDVQAYEQENDYGATHQGTGVPEPDGEE